MSIIWQSINPSIGVYQHIWSLSRRDAVIIHRLCMGHTRLTHSYLLSGTDQRECSASIISRYAIIDCLQFNNKLNKVRVVRHLPGMSGEITSFAVYIFYPFHDVQYKKNKIIRTKSGRIILQSSFQFTLRGVRVHNVHRLFCQSTLA